MKYSKQRELILKTLQQNMIHPTVDHIYELVKKELPNISLATVYRNLNSLAETGVIRRIQGLDNAVRFDHNMCNHYHFICTKCNKVYDVPQDIAPDLSDKLSAETGLTAKTYDITFKGVCHECQKKKQN